MTGNAVERFVLSGDCECFVNGDEVRQAAQQRFPKSCLQNCRKQFLQSVSPGWTDDAGWAEGCQNLTSQTPTSRFWSLYWCDSTFCGVAINQTGGLEQDPNVGLIINTCQNIGYHSVLDPGPPPSTYACQTGQSALSVCARHRIHADGTESAGVTQQTQVPADSLMSSVAGTSSTSVLIQAGAKSTAVATSTGTTSTSSTTAFHTGTPTLVASSASTTSGSRLSGGAKTAIGLSSAVALVAMVAAALLCLYRRKRRRNPPHRSLRTHLRLAQNIPPSSSPTPLISPVNSANNRGGPLTPPLRLRDRKFLASILRPGNRSPSPPLTPLTPAYSTPYNSGGNFPASPICSPTTSKLVPRHERKPHVHGGSLGSVSVDSTLPPIPPQIALSMVGGPTGTNSRGSLSSYGASSMTGHSSLRNEITIPPPVSPPAAAAYFSGAGSPNPPSSPARPPRPHDAPLEIPDLVSPASPTSLVAPLGPPPNRALPPPPPNPLSAALVPGSTASFTAVGGRAAMMMLRGPARVTATASAAGREIDEVDRDGDEYINLRGVSWGSWSDSKASEVVGASTASSTTITGSR